MRLDHLLSKETKRRETAIPPRSEVQIFKMQPLFNLEGTAGGYAAGVQNEELGDGDAFHSTFNTPHS